VADTLIVGGGIAAMFCQIYFSKERGLLIAPDFNGGAAYRLRPNLRFTKVLAKSSSSWGSLIFNLKNARMHDVNVLGGNSNYWGGFFDTEAFSMDELSPLLLCGVKLVPITMLETGSHSNCGTLCQMQDGNGKILNSSNYLNVDIDGYVDSIKFNGVNYDYSIINSKGELSFGVAGKIFLCVGTVQLIDLMYRSGLLNEGDVLTMTEYRHGLAIGMNNLTNSKSTVNGEVSIYYDIFRAVNHYLGIQKKTGLWSGMLVDIKQTFYAEKVDLKMTVEAEGRLTQVSEAKFGDSIHYCNLKINEVPVKEYFANVWPGIEVFGMASINQIKPGPISNDILKDIIKVYHES